jgi:hypothetical protein
MNFFYAFAHSLQALLENIKAAPALNLHLNQVVQTAPDAL